MSEVFHFDIILFVLFCFCFDLFCFVFVFLNKYVEVVGLLLTERERERYPQIYLPYPIGTTNFILFTYLDLKLCLPLQKLLVTLLSFTFFVIALPSCIIGIGIIQPIFLLEIIPVIIAYVFVQKYFIASSRSV